MAKHHIPEDLQAEIQAIRHTYKARLGTDKTKLNSLLEDLGPTNVKQTVEAMHPILHSISGSAGTFGFAKISAEARRIDEILKSITSQPTGKSTDTFIELINSEVKSFCQQLDTATVIDEHSSATSSKDSKKGSSTPNKISNVEHEGEIWLIEEDQYLAEQFTKQLVNFNFKIQVLGVKQALGTAKAKGWPAATVIDMDGPEYKATSDINVLFSETESSAAKLIMLSENDNFEQRMNAAKARALSFLKKPVGLSELLDHVESVIRKEQAEPPRVMLIDDDKELCSLLKLELESKGMLVNILLKIEDIISELTEFGPELVLLDMEMPHYSGIDIALLVRQHAQFESLPIVYLSAEQNQEKQAEALLFDADDFLVKPISNERLTSSIRSRVQRARVLEQLISKDSLTGLLKHAAIKEQAEREVKRAQREHIAVSIVMLDIDHFKRVNDTYGHATGDTVITSLATLLRHRLRQTDIIGRYGGEEFMIILPNTPENNAFQVVDKIRKAFSEIEFTSDNEAFYCTLSAGCVCTTDFPANTNAAELTEAADKALYASKGGGRNRVSRKQ